MFYAQAYKSNWRGFITKKVAWLVVAFFAATVVIFLLLNCLPSRGEILSAAPIRTREDHLNYIQANALDKPVIERYFHWTGGLFTGDLGFSWFYNAPVKDVIF